ncbi:MAG TPA: oligosaccharide flippase family protein [Thermoleophilaceae bacterium]
MTAQPAAREARLRTDVFLTFGGKVGSLALAFAATVIVARQLGPDGQGAFAVAYSLTLMMVQVGGLGLTTANPYFVAQDASRRAHVVANTLWLSLVLGAVLAGAGAALKVGVPSVVEGLGWTELGITLAGVPAALAGPFLQSVLLGEGRMRAYNAVELGQNVVLVAALVAGFAALDMGTAGALAALSGSRYLGAAGFLWVLARPGRPPMRPALGLAGEMLRFGFRAYVAILMTFVVVRLDLLLVNAYQGNGEAGLYSIAAAIADGMYLLPTVVGLNLFARIARGGETQTTAEVFRSVAVLYGLLCLVAVPIGIVGIPLVFGERYDDTVPLFMWLLPGIYALGMLTILAQHFAGRGFPLEAVLVWFPGIALNVAINVIWIPREGTYIAPLSSSISYGLLLALHVRLFAREVGGYGALRPSLGEVSRFVRVALARGPG